MDSISVIHQDEPIEIDKDDSNDENNMTSNDGSPKMIWLDHIEQGLILLISRNSEKFEKLLTSKDFVDDLDQIKQVDEEVLLKQIY